MAENFPDFQKSKSLFFWFWSICIILKHFVHPLSYRACVTSEIFQSQCFIHFPYFLFYYRDQIYPIFTSFQYTWPRIESSHCYQNQIQCVYRMKVGNELSQPVGTFTGRSNFNVSVFCFQKLLFVVFELF